MITFFYFAPLWRWNKNKQTWKKHLNSRKSRVYSGEGIKRHQSLFLTFFWGTKDIQRYFFRLVNEQDILELLLFTQSVLRMISPHERIKWSKEGRKNIIMTCMSMKPAIFKDFLMTWVSQNVAKQNVPANFCTDTFQANVTTESLLIFWQFTKVEWALRTIADYWVIFSPRKRINNGHAMCILFCVFRNRIEACDSNELKNFRGAWV